MFISINALYQTGKFDGKIIIRRKSTNSLKPIALTRHHVSLSGPGIPGDEHAVSALKEGRVSREADTQAIAAQLRGPTVEVTLGDGHWAAEPTAPGPGGQPG